VHTYFKNQTSKSKLVIIISTNLEAVPAETIDMSKKPGLDSRHRDVSGEIRQKNSTTRISALRKTYGQEFARGYTGDMKLGTLLDNSGVRTLREYLKRK
jgi:hypothetical protein